MLPNDQVTHVEFLDEYYYDCFFYQKGDVIPVQLSADGFTDCSGHCFCFATDGEGLRFLRAAEDIPVEEATHVEVMKSPRNLEWVPGIYPADKVDADGHIVFRPCGDDTNQFASKPSAWGFQYSGTYRLLTDKPALQTGGVFQLASPDQDGAPDNNPKTRVGGMNKVPLHLVPFAGLAHEAMAFSDGGFKYGPYNFAVEPISTTVYIGAALRHLYAYYYGGQDVSEDSGVHHLGAARACLGMILDGELRGTINDNRPPPVEDMDAFMGLLETLIPNMRERDTTKFDLHDIQGAS